jgi:ubiquitin-protein ligase
VANTVVNITLPIGYPKDKPHAESLDEVFHPNFGSWICIADFWAPNQSLVDIISQIADLIQFRKFNVHSPLNAVAAAWAQKAQLDSEIPLSEIDIVMPDLSNEIKIK